MQSWFPTVMALYFVSNLYFTQPRSILPSKSQPGTLKTSKLARTAFLKQSGFSPTVEKLKMGAFSTRKKYANNFNRKLQLPINEQQVGDNSDLENFKLKYPLMKKKRAIDKTDGNENKAYKRHLLPEENYRKRNVKTKKHKRKRKAGRNKKSEIAYEGRWDVKKSKIPKLKSGQIEPYLEEQSQNFPNDDVIGYEKVIDIEKPKQSFFTEELENIIETSTLKDESSNFNIKTNEDNSEDPEYLENYYGNMPYETFSDQLKDYGAEEDNKQKGSRVGKYFSNQLESYDPLMSEYPDEREVSLQNTRRKKKVQNEEYRDKSSDNYGENAQDVLFDKNEYTDYAENIFPGTIDDSKISEDDYKATHDQGLNREEDYKNKLARAHRKKSGNVYVNKKVNAKQREHQLNYLQNYKEKFREESIKYQNEAEIRTTHPKIDCTMNEDLINDIAYANKEESAEQSERRLNDLQNYHEKLHEESIKHQNEAELRTTHPKIDCTMNADHINDIVYVNKDESAEQSERRLNHLQNYHEKLHEESIKHQNEAELRTTHPKIDCTMNADHINDIVYVNKEESAEQSERRLNDLQNYHKKMHEESFKHQNEVELRTTRPRIDYTMNVDLNEINQKTMITEHQAHDDCVLDYQEASTIQQPTTTTTEEPCLYTKEEKYGSEHFVSQSEISELIEPRQEESIVTLGDIKLDADSFYLHRIFHQFYYDVLVTDIGSLTFQHNKTELYQRFNENVCALITVLLQSCSNGTNVIFECVIAMYEMVIADHRPEIIRRNYFLQRLKDLAHNHRNQDFPDISTLPNDKDAYIGHCVKYTKYETLWLHSTHRLVTNSGPLNIPNEMEWEQNGCPEFFENSDIHIAPEDDNEGINIAPPKLVENNLVKFRGPNHYSEYELYRKQKFLKYYQCMMMKINSIPNRPERLCYFSQFHRRFLRFIRRYRKNLGRKQWHKIDSAFKWFEHRKSDSLLGNSVLHWENDRKKLNKLVEEILSEGNSISYVLTRFFQLSFKPLVGMSKQKLVALLGCIFLMFLLTIISGYNLQVALRRRMARVNKFKNRNEQRNISPHQLTPR